MLFRYKAATGHRGFFAELLPRTPGYARVEGFGMSIRCDIRAIGGAMTAVRLDTRNPGAALLLTLLLISP